MQRTYAHKTAGASLDSKIHRLTPFLERNVEAARAAGIHALQFIPENHAAIHAEVLNFFG